MGAILQIVVLVVVLFSFFVAFMSSKTWRIYQVGLVVFIMFASMAFFYLAARTLQTRKAWALAHQKLVDEVGKVEKDVDALINGAYGPDHKLVSEGIKDLRIDLHRLALERGGVWSGATPSKVDAATGAVEVSVPAPAPHGIPAKMVVYVFEDAKSEEGGNFLGEFKVTTAGETSVELVPQLPLTPGQLQRLSQTKGTWSLYATMPYDNTAVFAGLSETEKNQILPKLTPEARAEFFSNQRTLHDYQLISSQIQLDRELLNDAIVKLNSSIARVEDALSRTAAQQKYRETEKAGLTEDSQRFDAERKAVAAYVEQLDAKIKELRSELKIAYDTNNRLAAELTTLQLKATEEINRRVGAEQAAATP